MTTILFVLLTLTARADETQAIYRAADYVMSLGDDPICRASTNERSCLIRRAHVGEQSPFYVVTFSGRCTFTVYVNAGSLQVNPGMGSATWSCR